MTRDPESLKVLDSPVQSESNFADNTIAEQFDQQEKHSVFERTAKAMDGLATFKTQRGAGFDLEEVMPEPFRIEGSNNIEAPNTLSANSLTIRLADVSLFLVANNLLDGSELVALIERIFDADQDYVFEKLFTLRSPTIHALCCRMLESISDKFDHQGCDKLLERLLRCGLDRSILAGPTGGRCIQLAITRRNEPLALLLLRNGVPRYPKLGLQGPFNRTLTQLAHLVGEQRVLRVLYGLPEDHPPVARPPRNEDERALREACEQRDFEQIQFLLDGGTDVDCVRDAIMWHTAFIRWETILEWAFFNDQQCYDMLLPYSQFEKSFWSLPGILTAANAGRQQLDAYLTRKRCSERDDPGTVLDIAISKGIQNHKTKEVRTMLGLELVSHRLDLEKVLVEAAHDLQLEIMDDLLQLGADLGALNSIQRTIDKHLWDALEKGPGNGALKQLLTFGCFSLEEAFVRSLNVLSAGCGPSDELENLKFLVEQGLDLDSAIFVKDDIDMRTPLQLAMELGTMEMVEYLVDAKGLVSNKTRGASHTDLGEAVSLMYPEIVRLLLQRNAEVGGFANDREMTVLEISVTRDDARGSSSDEDMEVFHALLEAGADLNGPSCRKRTSNWNTTLTTAIMNPHADKQIRIALDRGAGIHQMGGGKNARTPLQAAAESGRIDITKELLRRGACVNAPAAPDHGRTALQAACGGGKQSTELISLLLAEGADVSAPAARIYGRTALQALCSSETTSSELMALLIEKGADINAPPARNGGITALQGAAIMGNIKIAMLLINMGADINAPPSRHEGRMALDGAAEHGRLDTVQLLLTFKAECRVPGDSGFDSAIRLAEENGHFAIADILRGRKYE